MYSIRKMEMNQKRDLIKKLAGIGVVTTISTNSWTKPVVNAILTPAHAQTSPTTCQLSTFSVGLEAIVGESRSVNATIDFEFSEFIAREIRVRGAISAPAVVVNNTDPNSDVNIVYNSQVLSTAISNPNGLDGSFGLSLLLEIDQEGVIVDQELIIRVIFASFIIDFEPLDNSEEPCNIRISDSVITLEEPILIQPE